MTVIHRHFFERLLAATAIAVLGICGPLILLSIFYHVPTSVLYSDLIWSVIYGIVPTTVFLTLPVAVAIACTWFYARLASDFVVAALYSARFSTASVILPAVVVSMVAAGMVLVLSCIVAPHSVGHTHDVLHILKYNLSPGMLEPERVYKLDEGRRAISFQKWLDKSWVEGVFLQEQVQEKNEEHTIIAEKGEFIAFEQQTFLALYSGFIQIRNLKNRTLETVEFNQLTQMTGLRGASPPKRDWVGIFELDTPDFIRAYTPAQADRGNAIRWASEAIKRFCIPLLAIVHTLLGLGMVLAWGTVVQDDDWRLEMFYGVILSVHSLVLVVAEGAINIDVRLGWLAIAIIIAEAAVALVLINLNWLRFYLSRPGGLFGTMLASPH